MKAISLWEPWATLVRCKSKTIETRSWETKYRGPLLICAAKGGLSRLELIYVLTRPEIQAGLIPARSNNPGNTRGITYLNFGRMVARVNLIDCVRTEDISVEQIGQNVPFGDFSNHRYAWIFSDIIPVVMARVKGSQGFFNVADYLIHHEGGQ